MHLSVAHIIALTLLSDIIIKITRVKFRRDLKCIPTKNSAKRIFNGVFAIVTTGVIETETPTMP